MKLLTVKSNQDFIFKLVILVTSFMFLFFCIYMFHNLDFIIPYREGMEDYDEEDEEDQEDDDVQSENKKKKKNKKNKKKNKKSKSAPTRVNDDGGTDKNGYNIQKKSVIKNINMNLSYEDGNRDDALEKIDWYKNYTKAQIINEILNATRWKNNFSPLLKHRIDVYKFMTSGELDKIISTFPLVESVGSSNDMETDEADELDEPDEEEPEDEQENSSSTFSFF